VHDFSILKNIDPIPESPYYESIMVAHSVLFRMKDFHDSNIRNFKKLSLFGGLNKHMCMFMCE
jgi:hypothetical protein